MLYVLAPNNVVDTFPYRVVDLKSDNPNTSFPSNPSDALLAEWDVFPVYETAKPSHDDDQTADRNSTPELINGTWFVGWTVRDLTQTEIDDLAVDVRADRNKKLDDSDWTQIGDSPLSDADKTAWQTYRQDLRDIPNQAGFPTTVTWPAEP
jgi:hypothetical protein